MRKEVYVLPRELPREDSTNSKGSLLFAFFIVFSSCLYMFELDYEATVNNSWVSYVLKSGLTSL